MHKLITRSRHLGQTVKVFIYFLLLFVVYHLSELSVVVSHPELLITSFLLFLIISHFISKLLGLGGLRGYGFQKHRYGRLNLLLGFLTGLFFYLGALTFSILTGKVSFQGEFKLNQIVPMVIGIVLLTMLSSASEDVLTRGFVFSTLRGKMGSGTLIVFSSIIYVLNHIWRIGDGYTQWIMLFLMGLTFAIPYAKTGSLWFTVGCHGGWNTVSLYKDQISNFSDIKVQDHTSDWTYIITIAICCMFVTYVSKYLTKGEKSFNSYNAHPAEMNRRAFD